MNKNHPTSPREPSEALPQSEPHQLRTSNSELRTSPRRTPLGHWTFRVGYWIFLLILLLSLAALLLLRSPRPAPPTGWAQRPGTEPFILGVQYVPSTGNAGSETAEVFIANPTAEAVTFTNAALDGVTLPPLEEMVAQRAAASFRFDIGGRSVAPPPPAPLDSRATWWQFYPSATIPPGGAALFQINFRNAHGHSRPYPLTLTVSDGTPLDAAIPHYMPPPRRITAVTWSQDGHTAHIQYTRGAAPNSVLINGKASADFRILAPEGQGGPGVVAVPLGRAVAQGETVLAELGFGAEGVRRALVRAGPGIILDAGVWDDAKPLPEATRLEYGLDPAPSVHVLPYDVACDDTRAGLHGHSAPDAAVDRLKMFREDPSRLSAVDFCTALYPSIWNIYAPLADAVLAKPYQLHWGPDPARFIESEDEHLARAVTAANARPTVWVPERFHRNRYVEGEELKILAWTALLRGAKGIRYHYWKNDMTAPFRDCPDLGEAMKDINPYIRKNTAILSPLVPHAVRLDREQRVTVYEGWCGDAGVLLLVRNMRYTTDGNPNDNGRSPRFRAEISEDVTITFTSPPWLRPTDPTDLLTGKKIPSATDAGRATASRLAADPITITLPTLGSYQLIWIPNTDPKRMQKL